MSVGGFLGVGRVGVYLEGCGSGCKRRNISHQRRPVDIHSSDSSSRGSSKGDGAVDAAAEGEVARRTNATKKTTGRRNRRRR